MPVVPLLGKPVADLELADVSAFLADAGDEGLYFEAKADDSKRPGVHPGSIRKAVCGFANQQGGYLISVRREPRKASGGSYQGLSLPIRSPICDSARSSEMGCIRYRVSR